MAIENVPNDKKTMFSPFFEDRYQIKYLWWSLGFPLTFVDHSFTCLKFSPVLEYGKHALFLLLMSLSFAYFSYAQMKRQQTWNFTTATLSMLKEVGISDLDIGVLTCIPFVNLISNSIYFMSFKNDHPGWNRISKSLSNIDEEIEACLREKIPISHKSSLGRYKKWLILWIIMVISIGMMTLCWSTVFNSSENVSNVEKIIYGVVYFFFALGYIYPPVAYSADLIFSCIVSGTKSTFDKYEVLLKSWNARKRGENSDQTAPDPIQNVTSKLMSNGNNEEIETISTIMTRKSRAMENGETSFASFETLDEEKILSLGSNLIGVIKEINVSLTGIIVNTYLICLIMATGTLYSSSTILFQRSFSLILFSASNFCISLLTINRLIWLTAFGHQLSLSMKNCAYHLQRLKITLRDVDEQEFQLLKEELKYYSEAPITPFSAFSVSTSTLLSAFGTIITYLIVLLQFKVSEPPGDTQERQDHNTTSTSSFTATEPFNS